MLIPTIEVKDWIIAENNSNPVIVVTSYVNENTNEAQVIVQAINPMSFFYDPVILEAYETKGLEETKKIHDDMVDKYDLKRRKKE